MKKKYTWVKGHKRKVSRRNKYEADVINSPFSVALGWVHNGKLTKLGREIVKEYKAGYHKW